MPSSSPLSRCQAAYIRFHLALSKRFNDQFGLVYMLAFALVIFLGVSLVKYSAATQPEVCSHLPVTLVTPGTYAPLECAEWNFYRGAEAEFMAALEYRMVELAEELQVSPLTSAHVRYNFCGMVHRGKMMLNPTIKLAGQQTGPNVIISRLLCGDAKPSNGLTLMFSSEIEMEWRGVDGKRHTAVFEGDEAEDLQICMKILRGGQICGLPDRQ